ncbi:hypothetical protein [Hydrogenophaga sp.]
MGGGGDGGAGQMRADEEERQRKVQMAVDTVNSTFNGQGRQAMYKDIQDATRDVAGRDLDRQFTTASNQNLFGLARSGLLGGSVDAESGADLATRYGEGQIRATAAGQGAAADLQSVDERTRQNLISLAQSGMDTGTAASMAAGQMAAAADTARATSQGASVGRLFDDMGQAYLTNQQLRARYPTSTTQGSSTPSMFSNLFAGNSYGGTVRQ